MANITIQRTGEILRALFKLLLEQPDGLAAREALAELAGRIQLTEFEQGNFESGGRRFEKIVRYATIDCVKAGWLLKQKGRWSVSEDGREAMSYYHGDAEFYREAQRRYREWKRNQPSNDEPTVPTPAQEADIEQEAKEISITFEEAEGQAWDEIERFLKSMNPYEFQDLVASLLRAMGYHIAWISPPGKDGGIDILAFSDPLGTRPPRIKVQVKRYDSAITVDGLRSFMAVLSDDDVGLFVTTSKFTKDATDEARKQEKRKITLIDLERLFDLWVEYYGKLDDTARRQFPLRPIYFLAPDGK